LLIKNNTPMKFASLFVLLVVAFVSYCQAMKLNQREGNRLSAKVSAEA